MSRHVSSRLIIKTSVWFWYHVFRRITDSCLKWSPCRVIFWILYNLLRKCEQQHSSQRSFYKIFLLSLSVEKRRITASRPAIRNMFKQTLDIFLHVLVVFPRVDLLQYKVTSFVCRMVDTLGASVISYLQKALEQSLAETEPKQIWLIHMICQLHLFL